jgi:hypothetical protein
VKSGESGESEKSEESEESEETEESEESWESESPESSARAEFVIRNDEVGRMNRVAFCAFLALAALTAGALAQSKPSFAGHWTGVIDTAAQSATARANPGWTDGYRWYGGITVPADQMPMSIAQNEKTLTQFRSLRVLHEDPRF